MGIYSGVESGAVVYNKTEKRTQYTGIALQHTKAVCDAAQVSRASAYTSVLLFTLFRTFGQEFLCESKLNFYRRLPANGNNSPSTVWGPYLGTKLGLSRFSGMSARCGTRIEPAVFDNERETHQFTQCLPHVNGGTIYTVI